MYSTRKNVIILQVLLSRLFNIKELAITGEKSADHVYSTSNVLHALATWPSIRFLPPVPCLRLESLIFININKRDSDKSKIRQKIERKRERGAFFRAFEIP